MDKPWTDVYWVITVSDGELAINKFHNNSEASDFLEEMVADYGLDPVIHAAVIKSDAATSSRLSIDTQIITKVSVGGY